MASQTKYDNLFSESRNNVVALLTSTNISDPTISSAEYRKWIYARDPDIKAIDSNGYPYIVVNPADVDIEKDGGSVDGKSKMVYWDIEVEIVTSDRGYGENDGKGLTHMDAISDDVVQTFMNKTNRDTLSNNSMKYSNCTTTAVGTEVLNNELVYRRSIILSFKSRIAISA